MSKTIHIFKDACKWKCVTVVFAIQIHEFRVSNSVDDNLILSTLLRTIFWVHVSTLKHKQRVEKRLQNYAWARNKSRTWNLIIETANEKCTHAKAEQISFLFIFFEIKFLRTQFYLSCKGWWASHIFLFAFESIKSNRQQQQISRNINAIFVHGIHPNAVYVANAFFRFCIRHKNWFSAQFSIQGHSIILLKNA